MKTIALVAMTTAMWAALVLPVAPASASGAAEQCDPFGIAADFDCFNPGAPNKPAPPPSNPSGPPHVHCDCVKLVDDHSEPCCP